MHIITEHPDDPKFPTFHYKCDFMDYVANSGVLLFKHLLDIYLVSQRANCAGCEDKEKNFIKIKKKNMLVKVNSYLCALQLCHTTKNLSYLC